MEAIIVVVMLCIFVAAFVGYILNFVKLVKSQSITGLCLLRFAGIFVFPIGCIIGWIN